MGFEDYLMIALAISGAAAHIIAITPTKRDDEILGPIIKAIDLIAGNYGQAKNKDT